MYNLLWHVQEGGRSFGFTTFGEVPEQLTSGLCRRSHSVRQQNDGMRAVACENNIDSAMMNSFHFYRLQAV